jgi:hypothetical protein
MDVIKNLNPFLAQSEIELALQKVVFPPLIADFIEGNREAGDSFHGFLIGDRYIIKNIGEYSLDFILSENLVDPGVVKKNFDLIKELGAKSDISWNLDSFQLLEEKKIRMTFRKNQLLGKLIAASFPLVDFSAFSEKWDSGDHVFITDSEKHLLIGYSDYCYSKITPRNSRVQLSPRTGKPGKHLVVRSFPDYKQLVDGLKANELHVAFNLSALTDIQEKDIGLDDMKLANQYALFMVVTKKGQQRGLGDIDLINSIRGKFKDGFAGDKVLLSSGSIFPRVGFLIESIQFPLVENLRKRPISGNVTLLYYRNTINDRVKDIVENIIINMGYSFNATAIDPNTSRDRIDESQFDLVIKSRYIQFPEFLNLRYYKEYIEQNSPPQSSGYLRLIDRLLSRGGTLSQLQAEAQQLERTLLKQLPIVFFVRYNTRIAVRKGTQKYNATNGVPFFFYNLSRW